MSEVESNIPEVIDTTEVTVVEVPIVEEKIYRYQPTDESGRKLGGEQVIKYKTDQELAEKLRDQNVLLVRKLREVTRKQIVGVEDEPASSNAYEGPVQLQSKDLSVEERFKIAQKIQDPETFIEGRDELLESAFGVKPDVLRERINKIEKSQAQQEALTNFQLFMSQATDFYQCVENNQTLTAFMVKHRINPTVEGFKEAYEKVKVAGLLFDTPPVQEVTPTASAPAPELVSVRANSQPPAAPPIRIGSEGQPQTKRQVSVPSGLNDRTSSSSAPRSDGNLLTLTDIEKMPASEYRAKLRDPEFVAMVNKLEKEQTERRIAKMSQ